MTERALLLTSLALSAAVGFVCYEVVPSGALAATGVVLRHAGYCLVRAL